MILKTTDDTPMCERHEANYIQSEDFQNQDSHNSFSRQSHYDPNDSEKSLTKLNNDVRNDLEDFKIRDHSQCCTNKDGKGQAKGGMRGRGGMDGSGRGRSQGDRYGGNPSGNRVVLPVALHTESRNKKTPSDAISLLVILLQPVTPTCDIPLFVVS
ncbi:hypothetical protein Tco_0316807 [Tanacetum coccineum]